MISFTFKRLASGLVLLVVICVLAYALLYFNSSGIARNILGVNRS